MEALEATPMEVMVVTKGDVLLECGHTLHFPTGRPHKKERLWCRRCEDEKSVAAVGTGKAFRVKCRTCNYGRPKGGRLDSDTSAVRHREKRPHHVVDILDAAGTIVHTFQDSEAVTTLPDLPPF
ncbi:MAG TPA: hypothetical protein VIY48_04535 [Candidatus Paceibacterota bacterium]